MAGLGLTQTVFKSFASIEPFKKGLFELDHGHRMHWQLSGHPEGRPVLLIHGGPGSSSSALHRRLFDPEKFLIIQYDQRGCGLSEPKGATQSNTTPDLIADIERLRHELGVARWSVMGSSWGGTLTLLYVQAYPDVIDRVLLRSPFLASAAEIDGFVYSPRPSCQAVWTQLEQACRQGHTDSPGKTPILAHSYRTFCVEDDPVEQSKLARVWMNYESAMDAYPVPVTPTTDFGGRFDDRALIARYQVHTHYLQHRCFVTRTVLEQPGALHKIDLTLVHGDQDALCPFENSVVIQRAAPHANLVQVPGAGHSMFNERMIAALVEQFQAWA